MRGRPTSRDAFMSPVLALLCAACVGCSGDAWRWSEAAERAGQGAIGVTLTWSAADGAEGWLYSYGLSWELCDEPSLAERLGFWGVAKASHPLTFDDASQWLWHTPLDLNEGGMERFERRLPPGKYCGVRWLFSHGGKPRQGVLASMQVSEASRVVARSSHASGVTIPFEETVCVGEEVPEARLHLDTSAWLGSFRDAQNATLGARDAWLSLAAHLSVSLDSCH